MSSLGSDSLIDGFLTPSDIEEGEARYAWSTGGDGGGPQKFNQGKILPTLSGPLARREREKCC